MLVRTVSVASFATTATAVDSIASDTKDDEFYDIFKPKAVDEEELDLRNDATAALFQVTNFASFGRRRKHKTRRELGLVPVRTCSASEDADVEAVTEGEVIEPSVAAKTGMWTRQGQRVLGLVSRIRL